MPFSLTGPITMFSPQKNHFPKMKLTTFLESRKGGSGFSSQKALSFFSHVCFHTSLSSAP